MDSKTHPVAPQSKMPEVFAQLDSKITHMMKAVSAALVKDDRGGGAGGAGDSAAGGSGGGGGGGGGGDSSPSKDMVCRTQKSAMIAAKRVTAAKLRCRMWARGADYTATDFRTWPTEVPHQHNCSK